MSNYQIGHRVARYCCSVCFGGQNSYLKLEPNPAAVSCLYKNILIEKRPKLEKILNVSYDIVVFKHAEHPCDVCPRLPFPFVGANGGLLCQRTFDLLQERC